MKKNNRTVALHFISGLNVGGTETQLLRILPELQRYHSNHVCCFRGHGSIGKQLETSGIPVHYLNFRGIYDILVIFRFKKVIREIRPHIMITYLIHADIIGRILGRIFGIRNIICSKRGSLLQWEWLSLVDRVTSKLVTHYTTQTQASKKEWMKKLHLPDEKFTVIPNGINKNDYHISLNGQTKKKSLGIPNDSTIVTCVSKLRQGKGHRPLLKAFEILFESNNDDNFHLLLIGDGELYIQLFKQVQNYSSRDSIHFLGHRSDIPEILAISNIFILPTSGEGMSNAILEAMASSTPIITTNIPQNKELLGHDFDLYIPINNASAIKDAIFKLTHDAHLRQKLCRQAKSKLRNHYDHKIIAKHLAKLYTATINN
jgi:glycosyltransferase involved in cell wall biosynthesis